MTPKCRIVCILTMAIMIAGYVCILFGIYLVYSVADEYPGNETSFYNTTDTVLKGTTVRVNT